MSFKSNWMVYVQMMEEFCHDKLSASNFVDKYFALWTSDRDAEDEMTKTWDRRYDLELQDQLDRGEISRDEHKIRWRKLYDCTEVEEMVGHILDRTFTAGDCYWEDIPDEELNPPLVINAEMLRAEVRENLDEMKRLLALHNEERT
ncbi:MAG: hypothetical protein ACRC10_01040 [Thermoguttaceae bacterium]